VREGSAVACARSVAMVSVGGGVVTRLQARVKTIKGKRMKRRMVKVTPKIIPRYDAKMVAEFW